jgi:hypothetical protein
MRLVVLGPRRYGWRNSPRTAFLAKNRLVRGRHIVPRVGESLRKVCESAYVLFWCDAI